MLVARAYAPAFEGVFLWDDHVLAEGEPAFRRAPLLSLLTHPFWPEEALGDARPTYYRPLVLWSLRFDASLGGTPVEYHFTNIALHMLACCLLGVAARRLGARTSAGLVAGLAWGLAPRLTESVAWISGRTDVLAGVFGVAAIALTPDAAPTSETRRSMLTARAACAGLCLFAALLAKEVALAFALAIVVGAFAARRDGASVLRAALTTGIPAGTWLALRTIVLAGKKAPAQTLGAVTRAGTALEATARYAEMILVGTHPRTSIGMVGDLDVPRAVAGGVLVVAAIVVAIRYGRRLAPGARVGLVLAAAALAPVLHAVPIGLAGSVSADRLLYVPLAGIALALAVVTSTLERRARFLAAGAAFALCAVSFVATRARCADYTDEARFWVIAAEQAAPHNVAPRNSLALVVQKSGDVHLSCALYERSAQTLEDTHFAWQPPHKRTLEMLVNCWARDGRYVDAVRLSEDLSRRFPSSGRVQLGLGYARLHVKDFDGAMKAFERAAALDPSLSRITRPMLDELPSTRTATETLDKADAAAQARLMSDLGRAKDAEALYVMLASDATATHRVQQRAIDFLVFDGSVASAEKVVARTKSDIRRHALQEHLTERRAALNRIEALRPRIEALTE